MNETWRGLTRRERRHYIVGCFVAALGHALMGAFSLYRIADNHKRWGLFVGGVIALVVGLVLMLRQLRAFNQRKRRQQAGECPACGYDRRAQQPNAPCPECGTTPAAN
jgi:hypothetical protein